MIDEVLHFLGRAGTLLRVVASVLMIPALLPVHASSAPKGSGLIEAEAFSESSGVEVQSDGSLDSKQKLAKIEDGDWVLFRDVDLGAGVRQFKARTRIGWANTGLGGWIEVRKGAVDGPLLGRCLVVAVDIDNAWETRFTDIETTAGRHDIYLVFKADSPDTERLFELDWIRFSPEAPKTTGNPIIEHIRAADPSVHIWDHYDGDKFWMYASHDMPDATHYSSMDGYHVFSSSDLNTWTDHGEVLHSRDVAWGHKEGGFMWAPDAMYRDGKYYLYFPHKVDTDRTGWKSPWRIGVAVSDHPGGPFIPEPSYIEGTQGTDPACFIDDDGQAYLFFGSFQVGRLKPNMKELDPDFPGAGPNGHRKVELRNAPPVEKFMEGAWMHKHGDRYYYSWKQRVSDEASGVSYDAHYAVSDRPDGVFEYGGRLNRTPMRAQNHHSIAKIEDQWYFFYHVGGAGPHPANRRMVCVAYLNHLPDGSIELVEMSPEGVEILK